LGLAKHYETGEPLPEEIYSKLLAAKTFRAGSLSLRQVFSLSSLNPPSLRVHKRNKFQLSISKLIFEVDWHLKNWQFSACN
jgi:oligopeptidase A